MKLNKRNITGLFLAMIYCYSLVVLFFLNTQDHSNTAYKDTKLLQLTTFSFEDYSAPDSIHSNLKVVSDQSDKLKITPFIYSSAFELLADAQFNQYSVVSDDLEIAYTSTDIIYPFHNFL